MTIPVQGTKITIERSGVVLLAVGLLSSICVYLGHEWFHGQFLPAVGIDGALGDAVGSFSIIMVAFLGQHVASLAIFDDVYFGLLRSLRQLRRDKEKMRAEIAELDRLASTDRLTGAWNRRRLEEMVRGEIDRLRRYGHALSLLVIDIDHFKSINDSLGHNIGDSVLVALTALLRSSLRASDSLTRWGGEEFIVLCPHTSLATAVIFAERLRSAATQAAFEAVGRVTVSIGVAECLTGEEWPQWLGRADAALYRAKRQGRNQVQYAPEAPLRDAAAEIGSTSLVQLSWRKAYECGHETIDREHQALFSLANDLLNAIFAERPGGEIREIADLLIDEVATHFRDEEAIIAAAGFPDAPDHGEKHRGWSAPSRREPWRWGLSSSSWHRTWWPGISSGRTVRSSPICLVVARRPCRLAIDERGIKRSKSFVQAVTGAAAARPTTSGREQP
jgi:diguanylate cyclase (GGDEF)-like protein